MESGVSASKAVIFFLSRASHRLRQRETILNCPERYEVRGLTLNQTKDVERTLRVKRRSSLQRGKEFLARHFLTINRHRVPAAAKGADLLYCWGSFPRSRGRPFVVELDNPYVLTFYNVSRFRRLRNKIRALLLAKECRQIICISEACKSNLLQELGEELAFKVSVVYPFVQRPVRPEREHNAVPTFLFVANDFFLKGGRELLAVFKELNHSEVRARLVMVTELPAEYAAVNYEWCTVVTSGLEKKELFEQYFLSADGLLHPSLQDSFGMVALEAVAHGMPVLATDLYALREIVGVVDLLIEPPVRYFDRAHRPQLENWNRSFEERIRANQFPEFEHAIRFAVELLIDPEERRQYQELMRERFNSRFAPEVRAVAFTKAIEKALNG